MWHRPTGDRRFPATAGLLALMLAIAPGGVAADREVRTRVALGALAYADNCQSCHKLDGYGEEALYPSLQNPALLANKALLISTILHGRFRDSDRPTPLMPALNFLSDTEVAGIIAFISNTWGEEVLMITEDEVAEAR